MHCIIHQEHLCAKSIELSNVMALVQTTLEITVTNIDNLEYFWKHCMLSLVNCHVIQKFVGLVVGKSQIDFFHLQKLHYVWKWQVV